MGADIKYALLDTDFIFKSHIARDCKGHVLADIVIGFEDYEFFIHEKIKDELGKHELYPDPNPWLEKMISNGKIKMYSDRDIVNELQKIYGEGAINQYLTLLKTGCNASGNDFFEKYYDSVINADFSGDIDRFLKELKRCDDNIPSKKGIGEKKTFVLIQMMEIFYSDKVYVFYSDDSGARGSIAALSKPTNCISMLGIFYKLMKMGYEKTEMQEYFDRFSSYLKTQTIFKIWPVSGNKPLDIPKQQVFDEIYDGRYQLLKNGDLQYVS